MARDWKEVLRRRVEADGGVIAGAGAGDFAARLEAAIEMGAVWLAEQAAIRPKMAGLCLDYVSRHIVRRWRLVVGSTDEPEALATLFFLAERLEKKGVDASHISIRILEKVTGEQRGVKVSFRQPRFIPRTKDRKG